MDNFYIYSSLNFRLKNAGVTRMEYYARAVAANSARVYLVSSVKGKITEDSFIEIYPNVFMTKEEPSKNPFDVLRFPRKLYHFAKQHKGRSAFLYYPTPLIQLEFLSLVYLKMIKRQRVFYELNEIRRHSATFNPPVSIRKPVYSLKKIIFRSVFTLTPKLMPVFDGLICISTAIEEYAKERNIHTLRVPILTDPEIEPEEIKGTYAVRGAFNIGFSGSIHVEKERLGNFFQVIARLVKEGHNLHLNLCGLLKPVHENLIFGTILRELEIADHVTYYGNLNRAELSSFLSQQDLLVIPRGFTLQNSYGFSTKLSDYLNHKKPILITDVSDNGLYIKDGVNGFIVPPDDDEAMFGKLKYILQHYPEFYDEIVCNAQKTSRAHFHYLNYGQPLSKFLFEGR